MKKFVSILIFSFLSNFLVWSFETDISLFNEMTSAYNSGFYPGAIQHAERLIKNFPDSVFIANGYAVKGECHVRLGQLEEAEDALKNALVVTEKNSTLNLACVYWLARTYELTKRYEEALSEYHTYCKFATLGGTYYPNAIVNSGKVFYQLKDYQNAIPLFEYCVSNGKKYTSSVFNDALLKLADSYNKNGMPTKTISLFNKINKDDVGSLPYYLLMSYTGDAYKDLKEYKKAYDLYCEVLSSGEKSLSANALKKAYNISASYKSQVGTDPGDVLQNAQSSLEDSKDLLIEFWTRMGVDAYNQKDFRKAIKYFEEAKKTDNTEILEYIAIYRSLILAGEEISVASAHSAQSYLESVETELGLNESSLYFQEYNKLHIKYDVFKQNYEKAISRAAKVETLDSETKNFLGIAYYNFGDFIKACEMLSDSDSVLYALSLAKLQKLKEAASIFARVEKAQGLDDDARLDYAKVLLYSGRYTEAQIESAKCKQNEANYILGLAQFNTRSWKYSEQSFTKYINKAKADEKSFSYALFYQGYSQYKLGKTKEAYTNLANFVEKYPTHELSWNGYMAAANAAVQDKKYDLAINQAEQAIKYAANNDGRAEAVLLCAEIHSDAGQYENAINLLLPYSELKNDFGMKCIFQIARIYERQQMLEAADSKYKELAAKFSGNALAEEALYRRGELFYSAKDYKTALNRFNEYSKKYPAGSFVDAAWYFAADCMARTQNETRAILQHKALIKNYPDSTYVYSSAKSLMELNRNNKNYTEALEYAKFLLDKYGDQARNDGIANAAAELDKLAGGLTEEIVQKISDFESEGGIQTVSGRIIGTELAQMYSKAPSLYNEGVTLANKMLPLQKNNISIEHEYAALNAELIANNYRNSGKNKTAAEMYLSAAEYFRMSKNDEKAAGVLYAAVDAFNAEGLSGDANETAKLLQKLYPQSKQAKNVKVQE